VRHHNSGKSPDIDRTSLVILCNVYPEKKIILAEADRWFNRLARWLATFISGWLSLQLLQSKRTIPSWAEAGLASAQQGLSEAAPNGYGGRTLDLTLFAVTRAADVLVGELWSQHRTRRKATEKWTVVSSLSSLSSFLELIA
jgi:hypothetical protein